MGMSWPSRRASARASHSRRAPGGRARRQSGLCHGSARCLRAPSPARPRLPRGLGRRSPGPLRPALGSPRRPLSTPALRLLCTPRAAAAPPASDPMPGGCRATQRQQQRPWRLGRRAQRPQLPRPASLRQPQELWKRWRSPSCWPRGTAEPRSRAWLTSPRVPCTGCHWRGSLPSDAGLIARLPSPTPRSAAGIASCCAPAEVRSWRM
mmetsp:Transcript_74769/g.231988  ORF Transcript_74769/g.231988 Transcript_74769/m.231988 type:complete len:208 (-) Transcript_74769:356-979(-)